MNYFLLLMLSPIIIIIVYLISITIRSAIWGRNLLLDKKLKQSVYIIALFIVLNMAIVYMISIIIKHNTLPINYLYLFIPLFICIFRIYEASTKFKITNKGIIYHTIFYTWNDFINFNWNNDLLELITIKHKNVKINIPIEEKCKIDSLLSKCINIDLYNQTNKEL